MLVLRTYFKFLVLANLHFAYGALYTSFQELPTTVFDFIVVGAGAAGSVVASRLTENPTFSVLLIEAGINDEGMLGVQVPFLAPSNLPNSSVTWNYSTTPQAALNNRVLSYPRGRVLGGSSSINFLVYTRGSNDEYDLWARITGDEGWAWKNVAPYYFKSSKLVPPQDGHNITGEVDPKDHGSGPIDVSLPGFPTEIDDKVIRTSKTVPEFPFNLDFQSGDAVGVSLLQSTAGSGERSSAATAYLRPSLGRKNLHILIEHTVTGVVPINSAGDPLSFKSVEVAPSSLARRYMVAAKKEVILSAGAINTPQLLMLSGIGDEKELDSVGIRPVIDLPDVGKHLQDHPLFSNYFVVNSNHTLDDVLRNPDIANALLAQWMENRTGLFVDGPANPLAFLRVPSRSSLLKRFGDPTAGPKSPHFEMIFGDSYGATVVPQPPTGNFMTIQLALVSPTSTGTVRLGSPDPFTFPLIDPNFFSSPFDRALSIEAVRAARRFVQAQPFDGFIASRFGVVGSAETDDEIVAAVRKSIVTIWHPTSTARMAPRGSKWGVVDPDLKVKGVRGLRVVDASVIPRIPAAHTLGPVYILAERAADLIKRDWA